MTNRRRFLRRLSAAAGLSLAAPWLKASRSQALEAAVNGLAGRSADDVATDETFWYQVRNAFTVSPAIINLNNGGVSPSPRVVQEAVARYNQLSNETPSYYMWRILDQGREPIRRKLADLAGCSPEEIAINRNTSEALETVIFGLPLQAGDEVVLTRQDYPNMINAWKQREKRDGIVLKWINLELPSEDIGYLVRSFTEAFSSKTRLVHLTHMINWIGQILPVRQIADAAKARGIEVLVDAAHTFAHLQHTIPDLNCDYYGTSLHKWLCAPFGSGMLYVRKEKIAGLYPLFGAPDPAADDIRKFEHLGTRSFAIEQAIGQAIDFHHMIGAERKQKRLHYLKNYWAERVAGLPGVEVRTSRHPDFGCAIALLHIDGMEPGTVGSTLFRDHKIHTTSIVWENISGVRITPHVYTTTRDLDVLVDAIKAVATGSR